jgi:fructokinase
MENVNNHKVVCFGEVLWDILPSGPVPGGAPMNVAYHLHKQQKNPAVITSIGTDKKGQELIKIFSGYGICTDFFQVDYNHETGKVYAEPNENNEVVYDIVKPVAYDFIKWEDRFESLVSHAEFFVFGSLAARNKESKKTLLQLLDAAKIKVLDINLRAPHYTRRMVEELLSKADFLKLNLAELELITGWFSKYISVKDRVNSIIDRFKITNIVVTLGGDGAILCYNGSDYMHKGHKIVVADTIGSGDAFLAGLLAKLLDNETPPAALEFASRLGAFIATQKGACPEYNALAIDNLIQEKNKLYA